VDRVIIGVDPHKLDDIERLDAKLKSMKAELKTAVTATGSRLMDIHGIGPAGAARILADVGDVAASPTGPTSPPGPAPPPSTPPPASTPTTACHERRTAASTTCSTWPTSSSSATTPPAAPTTAAASRKGKPRWKRCAACAGASPTWSTGNSPPTPKSKRAREGTPGRLYCPARPAFPRTPALRTSHFPDPYPRPYPRHQLGHTSQPPGQAPPSGAAPEVSTWSALPGRTTLTPTSGAAHSKPPGPPS
jgi:transposase